MKNKRNRKDQISDVPSFSGLTYDCQQYRSSGTYHKEDCSGSHRGCRRQNRTSGNRKFKPSSSSLPEQDTKTVTYKGKVVDKDTLDNPIFEVVEHMPEFPTDGMSALMEYLSKNIKYPEAAMKKGTQGRATVQL